MVRGAMRSPFFGDYNYVSSTPATTASVWADTRDLEPGDDPREGADDDGFHGFENCNWTPDDINAAAYDPPLISDGCLSQGGLDMNIYVTVAD